MKPVPVSSSSANLSKRMEENKFRDGRSPFEVISRHVQRHGNANVQSWWDRTGLILAVLLDEAGYDLKAQFSGLRFHLRYIIPHLGPINAFPPMWRSFMTDDFSPLEFSWSWNSSETMPKIRYSIEAITHLAGSQNDPFNQEATIHLQNQLAGGFPQSDWTLFNVLRPIFCDLTLPTNCSAVIGDERASPSSAFLAFEMGTSIEMKAYFVPVRAEQCGISRWSIISEAIQTLRGYGSAYAAYDVLLGLLESGQGVTFDVVGVAIDCVQMKKSRFKVYIRSHRTCFEHVCILMGLQGRQDQISSLLRQELRDLWHLTLGLPNDFDEQKELPLNEHQTGGVLFNFDIRSEGSYPDPKLYIPVKHYGSSDFGIANGLGQFLKSRSSADYFDHYWNVLERACAHRKLSNERGFQTYIGVGLRGNGTLSLCSYLNGEIYHPNRWN